MRSLMAILMLISSSVYADKDVECMAEAIYHEGRGEPLAGQIAIANVIKNRLNDSRFPKTICKVIRQKYQFSYLWDGKLNRIKDKVAYEKATKIAKKVILDRIPDNTNGALFFRLATIRLPSYKHKRKIGLHIFYA